LWQEPSGRLNDLFYYGAEHVNAWRNAVDRYLQAPHCFACITDMPVGIDADIRIVPLDRSILAPRSRFPKLAVFRPDAADLIGETIWTFDLDTVICGPLDQLLDRMAGRDIVLWQNPMWGQPRRTQYNSSTVLLRAGTRPKVWTDYRPGVEPRDDQDWTTKCLGPDEAVWTKDDGIYWSELIQDGLPENARIVTFAGKRAPWLAAEQAKHPWICQHYG
jgi:hypothetical protein